MKRILAWIATVLVLSAIVHEVTIVMTPRIMMQLVMRRLEKLGGTGSIVHAPRADEHQHQVVMPSPDLLYSYCIYDLAKGPLRVHAEIPPDTYWSLSAFDARTDNFFAVNDRDAGAKSIDLLVISDEDANSRPVPGIHSIRSPSRRGLLLFRTLVDDDGRAVELDLARRRATCTSLPALDP